MRPATPRPAPMRRHPGRPPRGLSASRAQRVAAALILLAGFGVGHWTAPGRADTPGLPQPALAADAAQKLGVRRCLPAITAVAKRAVMGATMQDILLDWDRQAPDAGPVFSLTGLGAGDQRAGVTLAAVPSETGQCAMLVERFSGTARSCAAVAQSELPGLPATRLIDGITVYQNPAQASEVYVLIRNAGGCTILRRQTSFRWPLR